MGIVALLAEGVDRNAKAKAFSESETYVALLAEGVDRNTLMFGASKGQQQVALLAEGVDRNCCSASRAALWQSRRPPRGGRG